MDKMSLIAILTVSVPEHILDIILALLITGQKKHLRFTSKNLHKFLLAVVLMTVLICGGRAIIPNLLMFFAFALLSYTLVFKIVYKFKYYHSFLIALLIFGILTTINIVTYPVVITTLQETYSNVLTSDMMRFLISSPERIIQIILVVMLWNIDVILVNIKKYKTIQKITIMMIGTIYTIQVMLAFIVLSYFDILPKGLLITLISLCVVFALANILVFKFITIITKTVSLTVIKQQDKLNNMSFKVLYGLIKNNQVEKAKNLCKKQINKEEVG